VRKLYIFMRLLDLYTRCSFVMEEISLQAVGCAGGNRLLAGYLAHEFLRRSTLLGERRLQPSGRKEKEPALAVPARRFRGCSWRSGPASPALSTRRSSAAGSGLRSDRPAMP